MVTDDYRSYLLQLWRVEDENGCWRARLENVETGERQGFASLEMLMEFLRRLDIEGNQPGKEGGEDIDG